MHLFHENGEQVLPIYAPNKTFQTCQAKASNNKPILRFWRQFLRPSPPDKLIKHNVKETFNKGKIWVAFYVPKVEGSGGGQRKLFKKT